MMKDTVHFLQHEPGLGWQGSRILILLCLLLPIGVIPCLAAPVITVDEKVHQFGVLYVEDQKTVDHRFSIQNAGDETLVIRDIKTSCGCTRAEVSSHEIPPGESAALDASLQSKDRDGKEQIRISIYSNDPDQSVLEIGMSGFLVRHWELDPFKEGEPMLLVIPSTQVWEFKVVNNQILEETSGPWRILSATSSHPLVSVAPVGEGKAIERDGYRKTIYTYRATIQSGTRASSHEQVEIGLTTNDPAHSHLTTGAAWIVEGDLNMKPRNVRVQRSRYYSGGRGIPANQLKPSNRVMISSRSRTPFRILDAKATPPFQAEFSTGVQSTSAEIRLTVAGEEAARPNGFLRVTTDRAGEEVFDAKLHGIIQNQGPILTSSSSFSHIGTLFADEAQSVTHSFDLKNIGTRDLELSLGRIQGVTTEISSSRLTPGASATLKLAGDFRGLVGQVDLFAELRTNDPINATPTYHLTGEILPRWSLSSDPVNFRSVQPGVRESRTAKIMQFFPSWASPVELIASATGGASLEIGPMTKAYLPVGYGTAETEVKIHLISPANPGRYHLRLPVQTREPVQWAPPSIGIEWEVLGDIRFRPSALLFETSGGGQPKPVNFRIYSKEGKEFQVKEARAPEGFSVQETERKPGEIRYKITAARAPHPGEKLVFVLDRQDLPEVSVELRTTR